MKPTRPTREEMEKAIVAWTVAMRGWSWNRLQEAEDGLKALARRIVAARKGAKKNG